MKTLYLILAAVFLGALAGAQVGDGSYWHDGNGHYVTVDVVDVAAEPHDVQFTDSSGFSTTTTGAPGSNSTPARPTIRSSVPIPTPSGDQYRVVKAKFSDEIRVEILPAGEKKWKPLRKGKKPKPAGGRGPDRLTLGQPAPLPGVLTSYDLSVSVYLRAGDLAPFDGYFTPGEEITSVP